MKNKNTQIYIPSSAFPPARVNSLFQHTLAFIIKQKHTVQIYYNFACMYLVILGWLTFNQTQNKNTTFHILGEHYYGKHTLCEDEHMKQWIPSLVQRDWRTKGADVLEGARFSVSQGSRVHCSSWKSNSELDGRRWSIIRDCWSQLHCRKWIPSAAGRAVDVKKRPPGEANLGLKGFVSWVRSLT